MKDYRYKGHDFKLDFSKGCYVEVTHADAGYVCYFGVTLRSRIGDRGEYNLRKIYATASTISRDKLTSEGIDRPPEFETPQEALDYICNRYIEGLRDRKEREEAKKRFNPEQACEDLHKWFEDLKPEQDDE